MTGRKSGSVGLKPNHSSSCSGKSPNIYFALFIKFLILDFDNGLSNPPNSTVPTTLNPCSIGVIPKPLFEKKNIKNIQFDIEKPIIISEDKKYTFDKVVIACGAFSKRLTDNLGEKIPLDTERGYHVHFKNCDHLLNRPVIFSNRGFGITPMEQGLRVVGTVEFGGLENPLSKSRIKNLISNAKYMLGDLPEHEDEWLGFRPTLPDFLPVMGPSKNYKNVFYCFGHHHLGWTLGPISGKIVSGMIAKENTNLNLDPYSSIRFS